MSPVKKLHAPKRMPNRAIRLTQPGVPRRCLKVRRTLDYIPGAANRCHTPMPCRMARQRCRHYGVLSRQYLCGPVHSDFRGSPRRASAGRTGLNPRRVGPEYLELAGSCRRFAKLAWRLALNCGQWCGLPRPALMDRLPPVAASSRQRYRATDSVFATTPARNRLPVHQCTVHTMQGSKLRTTWWIAAGRGSVALAGRPASACSSAPG